MSNDITEDFKNVIAGLPLELLEELKRFLEEKPGARRKKALDALDIELLNRKGTFTIWNPETGELGYE